MHDLYVVEVEPDVRSWLGSLADRDFGRIDFLVAIVLASGEGCATGFGIEAPISSFAREIRKHPRSAS